MLTTMKARLALVLALAWVPVSWLWLDEYWTSEEWAASLTVGVVAAVTGVYAAFWVYESPGFPSVSIQTFRVPPMPRWLAYVAIGFMVFLIMGLPKVIF